jgi:hypothetical protein
MASRTGDPWEDEGFGGEDDWAAQESLEADVEDDDEELAGVEDEARLDDGDPDLDLDE